MRTTPPILGETEDGTGTIACDVYFRAVATGDGRATWLDAKVHWYAGTDRSTPIDSLILGAADVGSAWGAAAIGAGQTQEARWTFTAGAPFGASVEYKYKPANSDVRSATAEFSCGSTVAAGTPVPAITELALQSVPERPEPTDTLTIAYTATSAAGLWQTVVLLSGPCDDQRLFAEKLEKNVTRSVSIVIPPECELGVPLRVAVAAIDAGLQVGSRLLSTNISLVDETPPNIGAFFFSPEGFSGSDLSGIFFGGDSIQVRFLAQDNHRLRELQWEVLPTGAGIDGSLDVSSQVADPTVFVHLAPQASGPIQLRLSAQDAVGLASNTITTSAGATVAHPSVELPTDSVPVDGPSWDAIPDPRRGLVYLLQQAQRRILVVSLTNMSVTGTIPLSSMPNGFDITAGGDSLIVALPDERALGVVDLREAAWHSALVPVTALDPVADQRPSDVLALSNGKVFIAATNPSGYSNVLIEADLATGVQRVRTDAGVNGNINGNVMGRSLDHSVVVVNGGPDFFQRYDVATDHFGERKSVSGYVTPVLDATGTRVAVGVDVYDGSLQFLRRISTPLSPSYGTMHTVLSGDGNVLYQLFARPGVVRSRVSDGAILDRIIDQFRGDELRISDDGTLLVIFTRFDGLTPGVSTIQLQ
ncbi:MAG TPA: hypothetical protein VFK04_18535 [Gemmatimonadaceae bacterium]|nr:hypothetical protein [Gemmatimonadaceae bacterium]